MVFKVFCDITVSPIISEDLGDHENIGYDFIPKFDDNKENWDPKSTKKSTFVSVVALGSTTTTITKKVLPEPHETEKKENKTVEGDKKKEEENVQKNKEIISVEKKDNLPEEIKKDNTEGKENDNVIEKEVKLEVVSLTTNDLANVSSNASPSSSTSDHSQSLIKQRDVLGKRQRLPLEDITYLFVPEVHSLTPKRIKIIKNEKGKSPKNNTPSTEEKKSIKVHKTTSENSKENQSPLPLTSHHKTPLGNINNSSKININNNNNKICSGYNRSSNTIPKPCFINVKKTKPVRRTIIPKKSLKSKPNPFNISARMLR